MSTSKKAEYISGLVGEEVLYLSGYTDNCIIGFTFRDSVPVLVYSATRIIEELSKEMTFEEATEYFEYNVEGAFMGEKTPIFISEVEEIFDVNEDPGALIEEEPNTFQLISGKGVEPTYELSDDFSLSDDEEEDED